MAVRIREASKHHRGLASENACFPKLQQHPVDPVRGLTDILEEQNSAFHLFRSREPRGAYERGCHREVPAPDHALTLRVRVSRAGIPFLTPESRGQRLQKRDLGFARPVAGGEASRHRSLPGCESGF